MLKKYFTRFRLSAVSVSMRILYFFILFLSLDGFYLLFNYEEWGLLIIYIGLSSYFTNEAIKSNSNGELEELNQVRWTIYSPSVVIMIFWGAIFMIISNYNGIVLSFGLFLIQIFFLNKMLSLDDSQNNAPPSTRRW